MPKTSIFVLALILASGGTAAAGSRASFTVGSGGFFLSVGDYDYLPYADDGIAGRLGARPDLLEMMGQYGRWADVAPFGRVFRPYVSRDWRPYTYGHWIYTEYGPYWEGYEPWAWAGYHYGSWIFVHRIGWLWVPGYEWHPGRVAWASGTGTIGWMPLPPDGYAYVGGSLTLGAQFDRFGDSRTDLTARHAFTGRIGTTPGSDHPRTARKAPAVEPSVAPALWVFIDDESFGEDNYADHDLGGDYTTFAFAERESRFSTGPMEKSRLEAILGRRIATVPVESREIRAGTRNLRVVVPSGSSAVARIRRQSPGVVRHLLAPAFEEQGRAFKGPLSRNDESVSRMFEQDRGRPLTENRTRSQLTDQARAVRLDRDRRRTRAGAVARNRADRAMPGLLPGDLSTRPVGPDGIEPTGEVAHWKAVEIGGGISTARPIDPARGDVLVPIVESSGASPFDHAQPDADDVRIVTRSLESLRTHLPDLAENLYLRSVDGTITVSGRVESQAELDRTLQILSAVPGVRSIRNQLHVSVKGVR